MHMLTHNVTVYIASFFTSTQPPVITAPVFCCYSDILSLRKEFALQSVVQFLHLQSLDKLYASLSQTTLEKQHQQWI